MTRQKKIVTMLENYRPNIAEEDYVVLIEEFSEFDDALLVEAYRIAWVALSVRISGETERISREGKLHWMKLVHKHAARALERA